MSVEVAVMKGRQYLVWLYTASIPNRSLKMFKLFRRRLKGLSPTDNGNLVKAGQDHLSSAMTSKKSTLASVGKHSIKAGEKTVGINLIFLQTGTGNKLLELMKEAKLLEEEEEVEAKVEEKTRSRLSPKDAFNIGTSQEEEEADSDFSEVGLILVIQHEGKVFSIWHNPGNQLLPN